MHGDGLAGQGLGHEGRHGSAVVHTHPRTVGVEDARDPDVDAVGAVVGERQCLGVALGLVVDTAGADRVDVTPVGLGLGMHLRVAVHLGGRGQQEPRLLGQCQPQRVVGTERPDLQRLDR